MAEGNGAAASPTPSSLKGLREQMVAAAQALAEERRNQSGVSPVPVPSIATIKSTKPVIDGSILRSEERQRLAKERREEREKQHAAKETQILEKERKAKLQYEKQMEEKQKRLREQKLKEQQRRAAVEEKRKQKIEEEKERYEAVVHRTLERSQRLETRQKRWSWGGSVTDSDAKAANKRSASAANLKQAETVINKRLSSSTVLLNSPSKGSTKRSASLNRLNNKVPLNSEQPVPKGLQVEQKASSSNISSPVHAPKVPARSRSIDRLKAASPSSENVSLESAQKSQGGKQSSTSAGRRPPSPLFSGPRRSPSPANVGKRPPSPATIRQKAHPSSPSVLRQRPQSPVTVSKPAPIQRPSLTPNVLNITKKKTDMETKPKEKATDAAGQEPGVPAHTCEREMLVAASKTKEESSVSFTCLPELPSSSIYGLSPSAASPFCCQDSQPASSVARKILFGCDPMARLAGDPRPWSGSPIPSYADLVGRASSMGVLPPHPANPQNSGRSCSAKDARTGFPPNFAVEAAKQGSGMGVRPFRCFNFPYPQRTGSGFILASRSLPGRRVAQNHPTAMIADPFVLEKLLHTFQTMRCSVDNISQELRVLNTHLGNLSHHFATHPSYFPQHPQDGPD